MTIPSSLDPTLAPPGGHVVLLFTQYTPYHLNGEPWTVETKNQYADTGTLTTQSQVLTILKQRAFENTVAKVLNLDRSKILLFGKRLFLYQMIKGWTCPN